ncbi:nesprin-2-like isoform X2 [Plectropomus leopardus]|uniref:nesprin-2-like isoform X2 n=1 Tax=Plectropomus leopardus TaxID=160734 RepID=UPI001C4C0D47|nr:nesprin-2-like isoform X2 [Plectropomus leopardus]
MVEVTTKEKPKEVKDRDVQDVPAKVPTKDKNVAPQRLDQKTVGKEKVYKAAEVRTLQPATQSTTEMYEITSVTTAKESRTDKDQTSAHGKIVPEDKDLTSANVQPEKAAVEKAVVEVTTKEKPKEVKGRDVQEVHAKISTKDIPVAPQSLDEKTVGKQEIHKGAEVSILKSGTQTTTKEHEIVSVTIAKKPLTGKDQTSIQPKKVPENEDLISANVQPEKAAVEKAVVEVKTKEKSKEVKDRDVQELPAKVPTKDEHVAPQRLDQKTIGKGKVHKGAEVSISQPGTQSTIKEHEIPFDTIAKAPRIDVDQTNIQGEKVPLSKDLTSADVQPEKAAVKMSIVQVKTEERSKEVKDRGVHEKHAEVSPQDMQDAPKSFDETSVKKGDIHMGVHEYKPVTVEKESRMESIKQLETVKESKDVTASNLQAGKSSIEMTRVEVRETFTESPLEPSVVLRAQTESRVIDVKGKKNDEEKEGRKRTIPDAEKEKMAKVEILPTTSTTAEERLQRMDSPQEQLYKADKRSPTSLQAVQKSSTGIIWGDVSLLEGLPSRVSKGQAGSVVKTEKLVLGAPEGYATRSMFTEIQILSGTGPSSQLTEGKPLEAASRALITSTSDLDSLLSRLVSKVLSCKNHPAELNPTAMAQQLEEAQECRETAQAQLSWLTQLKGAVPENKEALEHVEDQWSTAVQDTTAVIQSKEAQLQLVTDYCTQTQAAKTTLERLTAELDAVRMSPQESSSKEAERLCALQRSMEEKRTLLGDLLVTHTKLCLHLSWSERTTAQTELKNIQEKWGDLERAVERTLYHTNVHKKETSSLLSVISGLQGHLERIGKDLEVKSPSATQWNCKKAQQLMVANADVKAAQQKYLHLQQLSEVLLLNSRREEDTTKIQQGLQRIKDQLCHTEKLVSSQTQSSSNPIMKKIIVVMRDGFAWAKQTESDIEGRRKRVALLPEEVHRQLRDLKKLQSEVMAKQGQLESLVEEVTELLPQLDQAEEVPMVRSSLESLEELSKLTTEKLARAVREIESGLQTREKMSEQVADLDSWVLAHLHRDVSRSPDSELRSPAEVERRVRQIQETLAEAEKQAAVCEALLMKSKDIASELSIMENCQLYDKLTNLQEDIRAISSYEKANKNELDKLTQTVESSKNNLATIETSLRQMLVDLSRHRFPITSESLQAVEPFKHMILEHKSQVDLLQPWIPREKSREVYSVISEILSKMVTMEMKAAGQEKYLNKRQCVEDLRENIQEQVHLTKDDSRELEDKYKVCQTLLAQLPLIKYMTKDAGSKLQMISADLYPSQLSTEQQRLKQNIKSLDTLEMTLYNNLSIIEWNLLKDLDLNSEKATTQEFLRKTLKEFQKLPVLEPDETVIDNEYQRVISLRKTVDSKMRALEVLEQKKGNKRGSGSKDLMDLKNAVLSECDSQMEKISQAKESLRGYTCSVRQAAQFLRDIEVSLLPPQGSAGLCAERLEETQQALVSLQQQFQTHVEQLQRQTALHPYLCPQKVEQLQENILSQLLVRMSTLQAKGHLRLERLSSCAEHHRKYSKCQDEIIQSVKSAENSLSQFICQKVTCLADCTDQQTKLGVLSEEVESLQKKLEELKEWCPEQSCRGGREATVAAIWKRVSRLRRCTQELTTRSKQRIAEWSEITNSVEKASTLLEQVEAELPDSSRMKASTEDLQDLLQSWEQYQDRLDCEHRALSALELRTARLQCVPAHLEQAPPTPLCQQLQAMQGRYGSVKQRSREGLKAARMELEEREKVREELQGVRVWLQAADGLLSQMEHSSSTQELQEVHSQLCNQKALLQRIMESLKMKYSDMYTLVPVEIDGQLQEVKQSLQQVEVKVGEAVEKSGPVHRLGAKLSEIQAGLMSVQKRLEQRSPNVTQAKITQKRVWDELDVWHSCLAALEVDMQDLEKPEEALALTERLVEVQQLHSRLAKQAEQRTTLLSKIHTWLQQHQEMITSSKTWMAEAKSWLATPCIYTTSKCLSSHVRTLQMVLDDSAQIRTTLQGFSSVLKEMSPVCDITTLQEQLIEADQQVANVQDSFTAPLSQLGHAADEVEAIESEVKRMESDVAEVKTFLSSPETFPSPREESLKAVEQKIQSMRRTVAEIQKCKPGLCLPEKAEETLTVFGVVDQLQTLLLELEKKVPALFIQQPPTPVQAKAPSAQQQTSPPQLLKPTSEEAEKDDVDQGEIRIVRVKEDLLKRTGASLQTVEQSSPEQRWSMTSESTQWEHQGVLQAEEATEKTESQEQRVEEGGGGVLWWLWDAFLGASPEEPMVVVPQETEGATEQTTEQTGEVRQDVEGPTDTTEASSSEALSKPAGTVRTQSQPESMVNTASSKPDSGQQQKCVVS